MKALADLVDGVMEATIAPSFSRVGFAVRQRLDHWAPAQSYDLAGRVVVLSGATSGIGFATARELVACGATVEIIGRDPARTQAAADRLRSDSTCRGTVNALIADTGDLAAIAQVADDLHARYAAIDVLVHNAGALTANFGRSPQEIEQTVASQVVGPFLLTHRLQSALNAAAFGRVLLVSSGGMYSQPLSVNALEMTPDNYNGTTAYARAKRAQVTLNEMFPSRWDPTSVRFHAMHPGWADTPGVQKALPTFRRLTRPFLRTSEQGADTLVWLAADDTLPLAGTGQFWLDRRVRSIHKTASTRTADTQRERDALWDWCIEKTRPYLGRYVR